MTNQEIGAKVRIRRKLLRLHQRDLAELAGVTLRGLTDLENGSANPTLKQLAEVTYCGACRKRVFGNKKVPFLLPFSRPAYDKEKLEVTPDRMWGWRAAELEKFRGFG